LPATKKESSLSNSKPTSKRHPSQQKSAGLGVIGREVVGVILLSITVLFLASIISYEPGDIVSVADGNIKNTMGRAGTYVAYGLFTSFGATSFLIPCITLICSIFFIFQRSVHFDKRSLLGLVLFFIFTSSILDLYFTRGIPDLNINIKNTGGWVGEFINSQALKPLLGDGWGAYLVSITGMVVTFMVSARFSFVKFFSGILSFLVSVLNGILSVLASIGGFIGRYFKERPGKKRPSVSGKKLTKEKKVKEKKQIEETADYPQQEPIITRVQEKPIPVSTKDRSFSLPPKGEYHLPPISLLEEVARIEPEGRDEELRENSRILLEKLRDFGVEGRIAKVCPGPVITRYEFEPAPGVKINKVSNLSDDLALAMSALSVRIVAPIPGRSVVGIEIPNHNRDTIFLREIMDSSKYRTSKKKSKLSLVLGKDIAGIPVVTDLAKMPHLLVAGSTGSGKSVSLNGIILSLLYNATPSELKLIMIDPKMLELGIYNGIPHLLIPTVTDPKKASKALAWAIDEMEQRYCLLADRGVRNIDQYNRLMAKKRAEYTDDEMGDDHHKQLPFIVLIIDEFADLMMTSTKEVEGYITRLAQMARAVGIHLIIATQRPSVDVITGLIKANFPSRISFRVASRVDSRTILDCMGAEKLLGLGDMLFLPPGSPNMERIHGPLVIEAEIRRIVKFLAEQSKPEYDYSIIGYDAKQKNIVGIGNKGEGLEEFDEVYDDAVIFVAHKGQASTSMVQRRFKIGYNRAANIIDIMEREGVVGPADGSKPREVLIPAPGSEA
jgi:S-DNA-T family DNA segregation ATPase FtsK/SpoIIIE